jgi:mono/diheme cytochrome c family protein
MRILFLLPVFTLLAACSGHDHEDSAEVDRAAAILALTGDTAAGEAVYGANCSSCHGEAGAGGDPGPNIQGVDPAFAVDTLLNGNGGMPSYASLADQEIADVVAYLQ